ncbi:MAG TPA: dihydrodipicolinate synthase family protein, partial [Nitrososphaerales archaeon]|nr:dihydrodipicolinate synthase family protein [Nitrososphaerales archaeon]
RFTGNNLEPGAVVELAKLGIAGMKDSSQNLLQLLDVISAVPDDFIVMNGIEEYGLFAMKSGARGLVSGAASALPELFRSMVTATEKGEEEKALDGQRLVQRAKAIVKSGPVAAYYEILRARGIDCGVPRRPLLPTSKSEAERMLAGIRRLGLI